MMDGRSRVVLVDGEEPSELLENFAMKTDLAAAVSTLATAGEVEIGTAPTAADADGTAGQIIVAADAIYVCVATDTWKKAALSTWGD